MRKLLTALLVFLLTAPLARAESFGGGYTFSFPVPGQMFGPFCASSTTDLTTYTFSGLALTGIADEDAVALWVMFGSEDALATFQHGAVTIDGLTASEVTDENGTGTVNTSVNRLSVLTNNAASVDVVIAATEAVTGMVTCVWAMKNVASYNAASSGVADDDTASGALVLTIPEATLAHMPQLGLCVSANAADTATWTILTEKVDTNNGEFSYSAADRQLTNNEAAGAATITCDYAAGDDASGVSVTTQR